MICCIMENDIIEQHSLTGILPVLLRLSNLAQSLSTQILYSFTSKLACLVTKQMYVAHVAILMFTKFIRVGHS